MLSYRHAFHTGNHADVLKHLVLVEVLRYLTQKDKPFWVIDTHAGAGMYALDAGHATKLAEYRDGIGRLWERTDLPPALAGYVELVKRANPGGALRRYPGSPWLSLQLLREADRLRLFELHSTDARLLQQNFADAMRQVQVFADDGLAGLKALLPPPPRRAMVLIDPSFELASDYRAVPAALKDALTRFATGTYAVWYPQLSRHDSVTFPDKLKRLAAKPHGWVHAALTVRQPTPDGFGMHGSGMFVINPPYTLAATLRQVLPLLVKLLGQDKGAKFTLEEQKS